MWLQAAILSGELYIAGSKRDGLEAKISQIIGLVSRGNWN